MLGERMPDLAHCAGTVVCQAIDNHRDSAGRIAFIPYLLERCTFQFAGTTFDSTLNRVLGHVGSERLVHRQTQPRILIRIRITAACSGGYLTDQTREQLAALGVLRVLAMLNIGPLAMPGHTDSPLSSMIRK